VQEISVKKENSSLFAVISKADTWLSLSASTFLPEVMNNCLLLHAVNSLGQINS